jgi:sialic acid synthase SpsE
METEVTSLPLQIGDLKISRDGPPVVIAEAGLDHGGSLKRLLDLAVAAHEGGAKIFKTQHYHVDDLVGSASPGWYKRMEERQLKDDDIALAKEEADQRGMVFLCTPHTDRALDFLVNDLKVKALKIGSGEVGNWPFIKKAADTGLPLIVSTGMYNYSQLSHLVRILYEARSPCAILHCVTAYPPTWTDLNLRAIEFLGKLWPGVFGYSDHAVGTMATVLSVAFGATLIEKHITLAEKGPLPSQDRDGAIVAPRSLKDLINFVDNAYGCIGLATKQVASEEFRSMSWATKSVTALRPIEKGEIVTEEALCVRRPGGGLMGGEAYKVVGKVAKVDISEGAFVLMGMVE